MLWCCRHCHRPSVGRSFWNLNTVILVFFMIYRYMWWHFESWGFLWSWCRLEVHYRVFTTNRGNFTVSWQCIDIICTVRDLKYFRKKIFHIKPWFSEVIYMISMKFQHWISIYIFSAFIFHIILFLLYFKMWF